MAKFRRRSFVLVAGISMIALGICLGVLSASVLVKPEKASTAVQSYLEALAANDAAAAQVWLETPPKDQTLLTDSVLKASNAKAPITKIATKDQTTTDSTVYATYQIGNQTATQVFNLRQTEAGWRIKLGTATITVGQTVGQLPVAVNGTTVKPGQELPVFPGTYVVTSNSPIVKLDKSSTTVKLVATKYQINPVTSLTEAGHATVLAEAKKSMANCLALKEVANSECPNIVSTSRNIVVDKDTVQWTLTNDPWKDIKFIPGDGNLVQALINVDFNLKLKFADEGDYQSGNQNISYQNVRVVVDVTSDPIKVTWPR